MSRRTKAKAKIPRKRAGLLDSAPLFAALGDQTRLQLIAALCAGSAMSIAQLTAGTQITRQAVTKHLMVLADAGLVHGTRMGRECLWTFEPTQLEQARHSLDTIAQHWDRALTRLKHMVEG